IHGESALPFAGIAAAAGLVEAEGARAEIPDAGLGGVGKDLANFVKHFQVGGRVAAGRAGQGGLIHEYHITDLASSLDFHLRNLNSRRKFFVLAPAQGRVKAVLDERRLSRSTDPGYHAQDAQRKIHSQVLKIVKPGADQANAAVIALPAFGWNTD